MKVLVLMGGRSAEREISLRTGEGIVRALGRLGHEVSAIDTATGAPLLAAGLEAVPQSADGLPAVTSGRALGAVGTAAQDVDVVFVALHGAEGEDGTIQSLLELAKVAYTGSGVLASALGMNKEMSRRLFHSAGVPIPRGLFLEDYSGGVPRSVGDFVGKVGWPVVVKPNEQGSTVGVTIVRENAQLHGALALAARYGRDVLIEEFIPGRELTVGILGDEALPAVEIIPESGFYDFEAKYTKGQSRYEVPAKMPEPHAMRVRELGRAAFRALGCRGFGRVDFRLHPDGTPYCLEVNTIPGMTELSLLPMAARAVGIEYDALVEQIVRHAIEKEAPARR